MSVSTAEQPVAKLVPVSPQELRETGLLWFLNRTLHPFGYCIAVTVETGEDGSQTTLEGLTALRTVDPLGMTFTEESEDASRRAFYEWAARDMAERSALLVAEAGPEQGGGSGSDGNPNEPRPDDDV